MSQGRAPIGEQLRNAALNLGSAAARLGRGGLTIWLEENGPELIAMVQQANVVRASALLHQLCEAQPWIAPMLNIAMGGNAKSAIDTLAMFDADLAMQLEANLPNFETLQDYWRRGEQP